MKEDTTKLETEQPNRKTSNISNMTVKRAMMLMNGEDARVAGAVRKALPDICRSAEAVATAIQDNGRVFYIGAGTSGRIAYQDVAELLPTFGFAPGAFNVIMAGGSKALTEAVEGAEDDTAAAARMLRKLRLSPHDVVFGITASGRTPFVIGGLKFAHLTGCVTVSLTSNPGSEVAKHSDISIVVRTGAEVITGSTRLKAGTAQKLVLNMVSTYAGIKSGRVAGNSMIRMLPTNFKLRKRAVAIVSQRAGCTMRKAEAVLESEGYDIEKALARLSHR